MKYVSRAEEIFDKVVKRTAKTIIGLFLLVLTPWLILQFPPVQTYIAQELMPFLKEKTGFEFQIEQVAIRWVESAKLKGVKVMDKNGRVMIDAKQIAVNYNLLGLLRNKNITLEEIYLNEAKVNLIRDEKTDNLNLLDFIDALAGESDPADTTKSTTVTRLEQIVLDDCAFRYYDPADTTQVLEGLNFSDLQIDHVSGEVIWLEIAPDYVDVVLRHAEAIESKSKLKIKKLSTFFHQTENELRFSDLDFHVGESIISDSVILRYDSNEDMAADFVNKVHLGIRAKNSVISTQDLAMFVPFFKQYKEKVTINGNFDGTVADFALQKFDIRFGKNSALKGNLKIKGLPAYDSAYYQLDLLPSQIGVNDLNQYLSPEVNKYINPLGLVQLNGFFTGTIQDFAVKTQAKSAIGSLQTETKLNTKTETYQVDLQVDSLNIGAILDMPQTLQKIDFKANTKGQGFKIAKAESDLAIQIKRIGALGYNYRNINLLASLHNNNLKTNLVLRDTNARADLDLAVNFRDSTANLKLDLDTLLLHKLNLVEQEILAKTNLTLNFKGFDLDNTQGLIDFNDTYVVYQQKDLMMRNLGIAISERNNRGTVVFNSELFKGKFAGNYTFSKLLNDLPSLAKEYALYFQNNDSIQTAYYRQKPIPKIEDYGKNAYQFDYELELTNLNPIIRLFTDEVHVSKKAKLKGTFFNEFEHNLILSGSLDSLSFGKNQIHKIQLDFSSYKGATSRELTADLVLSAEKQFFGNIKTEKFMLVSNLENNRMAFEQYVKQQDAFDSLSLRGEMFLLPNSQYKIRLFPSVVRVIDQAWVNTDTATVTIAGKEVNFRDFIFKGDNRLISIKGDLSEKANKEIALQIKNFDLVALRNVIGAEIGGTLNLNAVMDDVYASINIASNAKITDFTFNQFPFGNIGLEAIWNEKRQRLDLNGNITKDKAELISIFGAYSPKNETNKLNLRLKFQNADMAMASPFVKDYLSDFGGTLTGSMRVEGDFSEPKITGTLRTRKGKMKVNMLGTTYFFDDQIIFEENLIGVNNFSVRDDKGGKATVSGGLYHDGFKQFLIQVDGKLNKFKVLDTEAKPTELYYGTLNLSGNYKVFGTPSNLEISADVKTEKNSNLYLPLDGYTDLKKEESFIRFVSQKDESKEKEEKKEEVVENSFLKMRFNVEITPDAYCEIIFDKKAGDIIRGRGKGKIRLEIDDDFKIFGGVEITEGAYNFTFLNVINKEFTVGANSRIAWAGDPFTGTMNINAQYTQMVSLATIIDADSSVLNRPEIKRRYPVRTDLIVSGELLKPQIKFGIDISGYPNSIMAGSVPVPLGSYVASFKARLEADEQELNKQVFSLLALKQFTSPSAFASLGQSAGGSVSELLANQLSSWLSQADSNLEIDFDLNGLDADALRTFQLRLSYSFMNGRMRISRDGGFTNINNEASTSALIGDWTLEYLVTTDGRVRLKMYRRNAINTLNVGGLNNNSVAGVSVLYTRSFTSLADLLPKKGKKKEEEIE